MSVGRVRDCLASDCRPAFRNTVDAHGLGPIGTIRCYVEAGIKWPDELPSTSPARTADIWGGLLGDVTAIKPWNLELRIAS